VALAGVTAAACGGAQAGVANGGAAAQTGTLLLDATPAARVFVDDISRGLTPVRVDVPAGLHRVRFEGEGGVAKTLQVEVAAGAEVARSVELSRREAAPAPRPPEPVRRPEPPPVATGTLNVNATPWAEVWLDGRRIGETPLANVKTTAGSHEVVLRHPSLGEVRRTIVVSADEPARLTVSMKK
jgi:hypothetical protein